MVAPYGGFYKPYFAENMEKMPDRLAKIPKKGRMWLI